jgi:heterodisulfide reductase subunit C
VGIILTVYVSLAAAVNFIAALKEENDRGKDLVSRDRLFACLECGVCVANPARMYTTFKATHAA